MHEFLLPLPPRPSLAAEPGEILHSNVSSQGVAAKDREERIEEQPDADIIICNIVYPETVFCREWLPKIIKKKRIEEQPDADIIICNVVYPETGEILHSNVSSQGVVAQEKKENVEEQPDADI